jgi:thiol-disulfide isomerase/thioredoxin
MRLFLTLTALAVGFTAAAIAQEPKRLFDPKTKLGELFKKHEDKQDELAKKFAEDSAKETKRLVDAMLAILKESPEEPGAIEAVMFVLTNGELDEAEETAVAAVVTGKLLKSEKLAPLCATLAQLDSDRAKQLLKTIATESPHASVKGPALYYLAHRLIESASDDDLDPKKAAAAFAEAEKTLKLAAEYGKETFPPEDETVSGRVADAIKEKLAALATLRKLAVGQVVPDATAKVGEKSVKFADFRGKVVVIKYGAEWCGPCKAMKPHLDGLTARLKDDPFALIDVDIDENEELAKKWNINSVPSVYVLDGTGTIRFKGLRGKDLDKAVDELLKEAKK